MFKVESVVILAKGGEDTKGKGKRDKFKDVIGRIKTQMTRVEGAMADMMDQLDEMRARMEGFEKGLEDLKGNMLGPSMRQSTLCIMKGMCSRSRCWRPSR